LTAAESASSACFSRTIRSRPRGSSSPYGSIEIEVYAGPSMRDRLGEIFVGGIADDVLLPQIEAQLLREIERLTAHERIAMVRDGLLVPEVPHPGDVTPPA
jgi:hypothetical protein